MSHLSPRAGRVFFVEVKADSGNGERFVEARFAWLAIGFEPKVPEQISDGGGLDDGDISQRKIADGAHALLELAGDAGALAGVVAVVGAGREFVDEQGL